MACCSPCLTLTPVRIMRASGHFSCWNRFWINPQLRKEGDLTIPRRCYVDLLQEEQAGGGRSPLTHTHLQIQQTCAAHTTAICKNRRCPSSRRSEAWMETDWCGFQNKHPECESSRNSIFLPLCREWSYLLAAWKLPYTLPVMILMAAFPGGDKVACFFFWPWAGFNTRQYMSKCDSRTMCIKLQTQKEATSCITQGQKITKGELWKWR